MPKLAGRKDLANSRLGEISSFTQHVLTARTRSSKSRMPTLFANPKRQFRARRDPSLAPIRNIYTFYESESSKSESKDAREIDIETLTLEQYLTLNLNNTRRRISNPKDTTFEIKGNFLRELRKYTFSGSSTENAIEHIGKVLEVVSLFNINDSALLRVFPLTLVGVAKRCFGGVKTIQELANHSHKWHNKDSEKKYSYSIRYFAEIVKALNHEMDELKVDVRKINTNGEKKSLHEEIKSIRTSEISYNKSYPKPNIYPTNLKDTFEHYLKESFKRQDVLNEWMNKFMIKTKMNLKDHDSSIKRLEENVNHLAQLLFTHNLTNHECAIKLEPASKIPTLKVETFAKKIERCILKENARCSAILQNELPLKEKDPGSFILPCTIGTTIVTNALADLEASISIMPFHCLNSWDLGILNQLICPGSARLNDDSSEMFCNRNSNSSITVDYFVEMDDVWDNLNLRDLTNEATKFPVKPEFLNSGNRIHLHSPYNLQITCKIGFVNFDPYIEPESPFNIMSRKAYNSIMKHELVYTRNNMVGFARNLHVFIRGHQFLINFIILENINEFIEKGLTKVLFGQPFKEHMGINNDRVNGVVWFKIEDDKTIFNMPRAEKRFGSNSWEATFETDLTRSCVVALLI
uniref:Homeodomain-like protein n=1 Tax=Tanacetum cinerariifolium TaxID=118510 RepID=A0A6L2MAY2_TANCI|nr:homeodomain-like protein [Tanacetum cinerariifolium]